MANNKVYEIKTKIEYYEPYLPPRCRKYRYEEKSEEITLTIPKVKVTEAPVAFTLSDYHHVSENSTIIRVFNGKLYIRRTDRDMQYEEDMRKSGVRCVNPKYVGISPDKLHLRNYLPYSEETRNRENTIREYKKQIEGLIVINNELWEECGEPIYYIQTFGLGYNHGGTALFVSCYNGGMGLGTYYNALEGELAVKEVNRVAANRGDTDDVGRFKKMIKVYKPECVKLKKRDEYTNIGRVCVNTETQQLVLRYIQLYEKYYEEGEGGVAILNEQGIEYYKAKLNETKSNDRYREDSDIYSEDGVPFDPEKVVIQLMKVDEIEEEIEMLENRITRAKRQKSFLSGLVG